MQVQESLKMISFKCLLIIVINVLHVMKASVKNKFWEIFWKIKIIARYIMLGMAQMIIVLYKYCKKMI